MAEFRLGRNRPPVGKRKMHFRDYRTGVPLPVPPATCSYAPKAAGALKQMYLNDELGDCVIAGIAHLQGVFTGNAGAAPEQFTRDQIIALYSAIGGYIPGHDDTDNGCDERSALSYWQTNGAPFGQNQISGWLSVDGTNSHQVRQALYLFENLVFGIELPDKWINPAPSAPGFVWDVAGPADPDNGHCFVGVGYDQTGVQISTWGMLGKMTDQAIAAYASASGSGELYVVLTPAIIAKATQKSPAGFEFAQLAADFENF